MSHEPCNQIVKLSKSVEIYLWVASSITSALVLWATYVTVEMFAGKTADAVQITKYDVIINNLTEIKSDIKELKGSKK